MGFAEKKAARPPGILKAAGGLAAEAGGFNRLPTFRFKFTHVDHVQEVESGALFDRLVY